MATTRCSAAPTGRSTSPTSARSELPNRIDELVAAAARSLAGRRTRRDVLQRFGSLGAGVSLLGFEPLVDVFTAEARRPRSSWHAGAFGQDEVAVCYTPLQVV